MSASSEDFARAFGDALRAFLDEKGITYTDASARLGVQKQTLSTYWSDDGKGKRKKARAELLFRACIEFGFEFEYNGHRIAADTLMKPRKGAAARSEQLSFDFSRQFKLTEDSGLVYVRLKRHPGEVEFSVSLKAAS
jgi:transcriptional regulator with XRE-family HTH domain